MKRLRPVACSECPPISRHSMLDLNEVHCGDCMDVMQDIQMYQIGFVCENTEQAMILRECVMDFFERDRGREEIKKKNDGNRKD